MDYLKTLGLLVLVFLVLDVISFGMWVVSGQTPPDNIFFGTVTAHAVGFFLNA